MTARARTTDPITSHLAADDVEASGSARGQREAVKRGLHRFGRYGITSAELAQALGMDRHQVARRLPEIREAGAAWVLTVEVGTRSTCLIDENRRCTVCGRSSKVWRPVAPRAESLTR